MTASVQTAANSAAALFDSLNAARGDKTTGKKIDPQDRFLALLTTQLKNQDPLNPMDNQQMTSQLAQISTVDGISKLNATLQQLMGNATESQVMQAAALVGHGVLVPGSGMTLQDGAAVGGYQLDGPADKVTLTVKDGSGLVVTTIDLGAQEAGSHAFGWDGTAEGGAAAANGAYTVSASATRGSDKLNVKMLQFGVVSGVARTDQGALLNVGSLGSFRLADVNQIL